MKPWRTLLVLCVLSAGPALAQCPTAAEWSFDEGQSSYASFGGNGFSRGRGTTFEVECSGVLSSVTFLMGRAQDHDSMVQVAVWNVDAQGLPVGPPLAEETHSLGGIDDSVQKVEFALDESGATLEVGETYAATIVPVTLREEGNWLYLNGGSGDSATYEDGTNLRLTASGWSTDGSDHRFRVGLLDEVAVESVSWGSLKTRP